VSVNLKSRQIHIRQDRNDSDNRALDVDVAEGSGSHSCSGGGGEEEEEISP
jgi:hypothetical protein